MSQNVQDVDEANLAEYRKSVTPTAGRLETRLAAACQHWGVKGTLIVESLQVGSTLRAFDLVVHEIRRFATSDAAEYQPSVWTV